MLFASSPKAQPGAEAAWRVTLADLFEHGEQLGGEKPSKEVLGYDVVIEDPRRRSIANSVRPLPPISAVARFVWMMAGNDRLADIAFYEPQVKRYTDDDLLVPGSDYGARLRQSYAGTDQVQGAIERLRDGDEGIAGADGKLRRAVNVIWKPEDAVRGSKDIPCAFGLFYFPRDGKLVTQLAMRSNNAVALLPFNIFEFTLLAEVVATEAGLELGPFRVDAMSMHLYGWDEERARKILDSPQQREVKMPAMPSGSRPLDQINRLAQREADLRHEQHGLAEESLDEARARGEGLDSYWRSFFDVLLAAALAKAGRTETALEVAASLPEYFAAPVRADLEKRIAAEKESTPGGESSSNLHLFPSPPPGGDVAAAFREESVAVEHLHSLLDEIEGSEEIRLSHHQADELRCALEAEGVEIAARSEDGGDAEDFRRRDRDEVLRAIRELGFDR